MFRRRRPAGPPLADLLDNYLVRARAVAEGGGGNVWVVEPSLPAELLPEFTEAVVLHLAAHGVDCDGFAVLEGTSTARITVLPVVADAGSGDLPLRPVDPAPLSRRPAVDDVPADRGYESRSAR